MLRTVVIGRCNNIFKPDTTLRLGRCKLTSVLGVKHVASIGTTATARKDINQSISTPKPTSGTRNKKSGYISPYKDLFDMIEANRTTLNSNAMPPSPPSNELKCGISEEHLKFKTNSWGRLAQAPYVMPEEFKVVLEISIDALPFETDQEWEIFHKVVGENRVDKNRILRLVSNQFASRIENKRHTVSMLERIVKSVKMLDKE